MIHKLILLNLMNYVEMVHLEYTLILNLKNFLLHYPLIQILDKMVLELLYFVYLFYRI